MISQDNDTLLTAVNPEGVSYSLRPAGLIARALAYMVDSMVVVVILGILAAILYWTVMTPGTWIYLLASFVVQWFYHVIWEIFGKGATPGKKLFGIRVVAADGSPVSPGASFTRSLLRFADTFMGLSLIGVLAIFFSPGFRRLGDWAGGTLVVYKKAQGSSMPMSARGSSPLRLDEIHLSGEDKTAVISFSRRSGRFGDQRADEIARRLVPAITSDQEHLSAPGAYLKSIAAGLIGEDGSR